MLRRSLHGVSVALAASLVVATAADVARAADPCASVLAKPTEHPPCCEAMQGIRLSEPGSDCCANAEIATYDAGAVARGTTDVPPAPVARVMPRLLARARRSFRSSRLAVRSLALERPPDRRPPTDTTVILR